MASVGSIAEFPSIVKSLFLNPEINSAGIYAFKFYIRGKPWILTIDDDLPFDSVDN